MFEFNPYASYEISRADREARLQRAALLDDAIRERPAHPTRLRASRTVLAYLLGRLATSFVRWGRPSRRATLPQNGVVRQTARRRVPAGCAARSDRTRGDREVARSR